MSTKAPTPASQTIPPDAHIAIVAARFNADIVDELLRGCLQKLSDLGVPETRITVLRVPGAFELPVTAKALARTKRFAAVICWTWKSIGSPDWCSR